MGWLPDIILQELTFRVLRQSPAVAEIVLGSSLLT
jgi:hypothetical protein